MRCFYRGCASLTGIVETTGRCREWREMLRILLRLGGYYVDGEEERAPFRSSYFSVLVSNMLGSLRKVYMILGRYGVCI